MSGEARERASGIDLITDERQRQIDKERWTPEHDDKHQEGALYAAALCYLRADGPNAKVTNLWPWGAKWWKPKDRVRNLVRAGALLLAEQDRIGRMRTAIGLWPQRVEIPFLVEGIAAEIDRLQRAGERDGGDG